MLEHAENTENAGRAMSSQPRMSCTYLTYIILHSASTSSSKSQPVDDAGTRPSPRSLKFSILCPSSQAAPSRLEWQSVLLPVRPASPLPLSRQPSLAQCPSGPCKSLLYSYHDLPNRSTRAPRLPHARRIILAWSKAKRPCFFLSLPL